MKLLIVCNTQTYSYNLRLEQAILGGINQSFEIHYQNSHLNQLQRLHIKTLIDNLQAVNWQLHHMDQYSKNTNERSSECKYIQSRSLV